MYNQYRVVRLGDPKPIGAPSYKVPFKLQQGALCRTVFREYFFNGRTSRVKSRARLSRGEDCYVCSTARDANDTLKGRETPRDAPSGPVKNPSGANGPRRRGQWSERLAACNAAATCKQVGVFGVIFRAGVRGDYICTSVRVNPSCRERRGRKALKTLDILCAACV